MTRGIYKSRVDAVGVRQWLPIKWEDKMSNWEGRMGEWEALKCKGWGIWTQNEETPLSWPPHWENSKEQATEQLHIYISKLIDKIYKYTDRTDSMFVPFLKRIGIVKSWIYLKVFGIFAWVRLLSVSTWEGKLQSGVVTWVVWRLWSCWQRQCQSVMSCQYQWKVWVHH